MSERCLSLVLKYLQSPLLQDMPLPRYLSALPTLHRILLVLHSGFEVYEVVLLSVVFVAQLWSCNHILSVSDCCSGHHVRWGTAAMLLVNSSQLQGVLWKLLRSGRSGLDWVMHTLPRLGWLLVAAEACYCNGSVLMHGGPQIPSQRSVLSTWLQVCNVISKARL
jgi:hypothetical protein